MLWYTVPEAAKVAHVHPKALRRAIHHGDIPVWRISARKTYVYWDEVVKWLESR